MDKNLNWFESIKREMKMIGRDLFRFIKSSYFFETVFIVSQIIIMMSYIILKIYYSDAINTLEEPFIRKNFDFIFKINRVKDIANIISMLTILSRKIELKKIFRVLLITGSVVFFIDYIF